MASLPGSWLPLYFTLQCGVLPSGGWDSGSGCSWAAASIPLSSWSPGGITEFWLREVVPNKQPTKHQMPPTKGMTFCVSCPYPGCNRRTVGVWKLVLVISSSVKLPHYQVLLVLLELSSFGSCPNQSYLYATFLCVLNSEIIKYTHLLLHFLPAQFK